MAVSIAPLARQWAAGATFSYIVTGAANQDAQNIISTGGILFGYEFYNLTATTRFAKIYDKQNPTSADTPWRRIAIPGFGTSTVGGVARDIAGGHGVRFEVGMSIRVTTGEADNDANACASGDVVYNVDFS